ncbi:MAG: hypothetical protein KF886_21850 [Candidatus Hydrogenedentes bacterium]|nr:hypothetical protein [Candidatus Hydrogenedentota bacterium]
MNTASQDPQIISPHGAGRGAHYITAQRAPGESLETVLERAMAALRETGATLVSMDILGIPMHPGLPAVERITGPVAWPLTWIAAPRTGGAGGIQLWAESEAGVTPIRLRGQIAGSLVDTPHATIARLGGLTGRIPTRTEAEQTLAALHEFEDALHAAGMDFEHTVRTWYYNCDIVSWYNDFNRARNEFFSEHRVYEGLLPASTGIGACNVSGSSIVGGLIAVKPKSDAVTIAAVPSPLQGAATDYGSSFSRAAEINFPDARLVFISGTASIEPHGKTIHENDIDGQIRRTMEVVAAILRSRHMDWAHVTRAIAYLKHPEDCGRFEAYRREHGLENLPIITMTAEVCRDNLLFEMEADAARVTNGNGA